ncbi:MAG: M23 family metallopeptidase [Candidatus Pacebacteria bacterium]|nr:M23 family metallopeptidase [Candidatus Paceibacterota bacterium]MBP9852056.1 M23 family metallopeptidase [Candidatus Paceibacterota bacterium]
MNGSPKKPSFIRHFRKSAGIIPLALILLASTFGAGHADAGAFSIFSTASGKTQSENAPTIQKMRILEVVFSPTLDGKGGQDVITDESALISNDTAMADALAAANADGSAAAEEDVAVDHEGEATIKTYVVKSGDTISSIAEKNGVSINTIVWANNLDRKATLKIGEELTILPVSGIQYTVRRGDTIDSIAKRYGAETNDIQDFNDITNAGLIAGVKIIVPGAELSPVAIATAVAKAPAKTTVTPSVAPKVTVTPKAAPTPAPLAVPVPAESLGELVHGTLIRPTVNNGSSAGFIRPIAEGLGRKSQDIHDRYAVDLAVAIGTPIMAAQTGTVILVKSGGYNGGYGSYVVIEHAGGIQTLYAHMSKTIAKVGDVVSQGETIGLVGSTGRSTGPHVHYEVRGAPNNCFKACE